MLETMVYWIAELIYDYVVNVCERSRKRTKEEKRRSEKRERERDRDRRTQRENYLKFKQKKMHMFYGKWSYWTSISVKHINFNV